MSNDFASGRGKGSLVIINKTVEMRSGGELWVYPGGYQEIQRHFCLR
jgi:hypothetical protein